MKSTDSTRAGERRATSSLPILVSIGFAILASPLTGQEPPPDADTARATQRQAPPSAVVYGRVVLGDPPRAVPDAVVYVPGTQATAVADSTGAFALRLPPGPWLLSVYVPGIDETGRAGPPSALVTLEAGDTVRASFRNTRDDKGDLTNPYVLDALEVVVSRPAIEARLREGALQRVLTSEEIRMAEISARDVGDLLRGRMSGIAVERVILPGGENVLCIQARRAMLVRGDGNRCPGQVAVWVDGVPVTDPSGFLLSLPPDQIEQVDFLSGVQAGAEYGLNGGNGVLLITTRRPASRNETRRR